jgi:cell division transport system permease protein
MLTVLKRIIKLGWQNFSRDGGVLATTVFVLVLTISLVTSTFLLKEVSRFLVASLKEKVDISVYFKEETEEIAILDIKDNLYEIPEVESVKYISREEALEVFIQKHKRDPVLMKSLEEVGWNPFLASLNIKAKDYTQYVKITGFLEDSIFSDLIEKVNYYERKPVIDRIFSLANSAQKVGMALALLLGLLSFLIVLNTIRLAIYSQREEIKIQKLVGASNWFIRGPFLVQGVFAGVLAAFIALLLFVLLSWSLSPKIEVFFSDLNIWNYFTSNLLVIILIQLGTGIFLGTVSGTIAIRKYLEV